MKENKVLNFIGNGSCFNTAFGNNSAYYFNNQKQSLLLIDCGETVFERLMKQKFLENIKAIDILITHMHTDHIGSLSSLVFYCEYGKGIIPTVIYPDKSSMQQFLTLVGNEPQSYKLINPAECEKYRIKEIKQEHSKFINAYGYILELEGKRIYYSGDTKTIQMPIIEALKKGVFDDEITKTKAESMGFSIAKVKNNKDIER